jgi:hypothetical protein
MEAVLRMAATRARNVVEEGLIGPAR